LLVLATGYRPQYRVLRCAAALGARVYVAGPECARSLALSRFCRGFFQIPLDETDPSIGRRLDRLCAREKIWIVLPSDAVTTRFLSAVGHTLATPRFPVPDADSFHHLNTKERFATVCQTLGLPHPTTRLYANATALLTALSNGHLRLPAILKPI